MDYAERNNLKRINQIFAPINKGGEEQKDAQLTDEEEEDDDVKNDALKKKRYTENELDEAIQSLDPYSNVLLSHNEKEFKRLEKKHNFKLTPALLQRFHAIREYFIRLQTNQCTTVQSSSMVAAQLYAKSGDRDCWKARSIRSWARYYVQHKTLKPSRAGRHIKTNTIILDENFQAAFRVMLRGMNEIERTPPNIRRKVVSDLFPLFPHSPNAVTEPAIRRWMRHVGYMKSFARKTYYKRASRHCQRFMEGYRAGLEGPLLDYAMKKYRGHRTINAEQAKLITEEFNKIQAAKRKEQQLHI